MTKRLVTLKPKPVCGGQRHDGETCMSTVLMANGRCRMHGGKAGMPPVHGLYSKLVPKGWEPDYEYFKANPEILCSVPEIALAQTHLARWLSILQADIALGKTVTALQLSIGMEHLEKVTKLQERESKRLSNERVVNELIARQVTEEMNALREILATHCDPTTADKVLAEFARRCGDFESPPTDR